MATWQSLLLPLLFALLLVWASPTPSHALAPEYRSAVNSKLWWIFYRHPVYKLGRNDVNAVDCSGLIGLACESLPVRQRTQAYRIYLGLDGYVNKPVSLRDNEAVDLFCWHIPNGLERPEGVNHIGIAVVEPHTGIFQVMHASSSKRGVVVVPFQGWTERYLVPNGYRRLTIGDKK